METLLDSETCDARLLRFSLKDLIPEEIVEKLWSLNLEKNPPIKIYGKICKQKRNVGFFSDTSEGYRYSGNIVKAQKLTRELKILLCMVNKVFKEKFNGILVNLYENGMNTIGAHSDDEKALGNSGVVSISFGATRKFVIREKVTKKIVKTVSLRDGDMVCMFGSDFQKKYTHEIPEDKNIDDPRLSLTFRHHLK